MALVFPVATMAATYTKAEMLDYMDDVSSYDAFYTLTSNTCDDDVYVNPNSLLIFSPGFANSATGKFSDASIFFYSFSWYEAHGPMKRKAGKNFYTIRLTDSNSTNGKVVFKARVKKNDPTNLYHIRVTITNYQGEGCTVKAKV